MQGEIQLVRFCKVVDVSDETDSDRIKVRICPDDNDTKLEDLPYAFPLLPKMFHVKPKVGEAVLIFLAIANNGNSQRYYIGPVISQDHRIYNDPYFSGADSFFNGKPKDFDEAHSKYGDENGIFPNDNDIVIRGRKNADIQVTYDDVRIKAGVKVVNDNNEYKMTFNTRNPAYAKLKYHKKNLAGDTKSTASVVADKICLLSNNSPNYYNLTDRKDLITDEELNKVIKSAYKLPYGEKLVDFLKVFVNAFVNHTHNFPMIPPNPFHTSELLTKKAEFLDREAMLSDTVRIN